MNHHAQIQENSRLQQLVKQNSPGTKKLFKLVDELTGSKDQNHVQEAKSDKDLAEDFAVLH